MQRYHHRLYHSLTIHFHFFYGNCNDKVVFRHPLASRFETYYIFERNDIYVNIFPFSPFRAELSITHKATSQIIGINHGAKMSPDDGKWNKRTDAHLSQGCLVYITIDVSYSYRTLSFRFERWIMRTDGLGFACTNRNYNANSDALSTANAVTSPYCIHSVRKKKYNTCTTTWSARVPNPQSPRVLQKSLFFLLPRISYVINYLTALFSERFCLTFRRWPPGSGCMVTKLVF